MCSGRVDLSFILRAFASGADGVIIGACWPGECHYITEGNYDALGNMHLCRKLLDHVGLSPERMRIAWIAASEGARFAEVMNEFVGKVRELGPLGRGEGLEPETLGPRLEAITRLVPYIRLVERQKLRAPERTEEAYNAFYAGEEAGRLFDELVANKLVTSQILLLLKKEPLSTRQIAEMLGLHPSQVAKHMNDSSRQGLVRFDPEHQRYALA